MGPGYGSVQINIDGQRDIYGTANASSSSMQYQQLLWSKTQLGPGDHQIVITRTAPGPISLDHFKITPLNNTIIPLSSGTGASIIPSEALIVDNTSNRIKYSGNQWTSVSTGNANVGFFNNSLQTTTSPGAAAVFDFDGTAIWYYSDVDITHGFVNISVDGGLPERVSGYHDPVSSQYLIWSRTNLPAGTHSVTITHSDVAGQFATLDFFRYLPSNVTQPGGKDQSQKLPVGAITGGAVGGAVLVVLCCGVFFFYRHRKQRRNRARKDDWSIEPAPEMAERVEPYETTPFLMAHEAQASLATRDTHDKFRNTSTSVGPHPAAFGAATRMDTHANEGASSHPIIDTPDDLPPSYQ
ncbi:transmembrane protein [Ceratobasidium sp. AG-Ba]|nr:transmembrane protein [Ceratobasidium sp. AG-Ba]